MNHMQKSLSARARPLRFVIIGAGLSGIMSAIKLAAAGYHDIVIFEKAAGPGGTWRDNTYPGVACDIPSHFYSYSFAPNPDWSHRFASGGEIQRYVEAVIHRFSVDRRIRFNEEVLSCRFADGRWKITLRSGHSDVADVIIAATGVTHHPQLPDIPGLASFAGAAFHSASWNHATDLDGGRIGVIGTGSSAAQIVSALVARASKLTLFQRTPQWILPQENLSYSDAERARFRDSPEALSTLRADIARRFTVQFANALSNAESPELETIATTCLTHLETQVSDPVLRERLRPTYRAGCKRLVVSSEFYRAIQQPNAELVVDRIERVEPEGVRTADGRLHELDVLVLATGFKTDRFMRPIDVVGDTGSSLEAQWSQKPSAYLTVAIPGFPNFFMLNGPNSPVGNFPLIEVAEVQMNYIVQLVSLLRTDRYTAISARAESADRFERERVAATQRTVWATGCKSWYLDADGVPSAWPWSIERFYADLASPNLDDYELTA
jgi:cation diffusion facilitator CzcD-associated flavoprotein CzcO